MHHHHSGGTDLAATNAISNVAQPAPAEVPSSSAGNSGVGVVILMIAAYFGPTLVAILRKRQNVGAIFALNLFLGWTVLGWIIAFVWSLTATPTVIVQTVKR